MSGPRSRWATIAIVVLATGDVWGQPDNGLTTDAKHPDAATSPVPPESHQPARVGAPAPVDEPARVDEPAPVDEPDPREAEIRALRAQLEESIERLKSSVQDLDERVPDPAEGAGDRGVVFTIAGTATASYAKQLDGRGSYAASFSPHFFWSFYDRVLFESHVDVSTNLNLEFAAAWLIVDDHLVVGVGKLLAPFGFYMEGIHTAWVNKLPDEPLPVADHVGLTPTHFYGVEARGVTELGGGRVAAAVYAGSAGLLDLESDGTVHGNLVDFDRVGRGAGGARLTYQPVPALEVGVSAQAARIDPYTHGTKPPLYGAVMTWTAGADASYNDTIGALSGTVDLKLEYIVARLVQSDGASFDRSRYGLYAQLAYAPTEVDTKWLRRLEGVVRYDRLGPSAPEVAIDRLAAGLDYWVTASVVGKLAYELTFARSAMGPSHQQAILAQAALGF